MESEMNLEVLPT